MRRRWWDSSGQISNILAFLGNYVLVFRLVAFCSSMSIFVGSCAIRAEFDRSSCWWVLRAIIIICGYVIYKAMRMATCVAVGFNLQWEPRARAHIVLMRRLNIYRANFGSKAMRVCYARKLHNYFVRIVSVRREYTYNIQQQNKKSRLPECCAFLYILAAFKRRHARQLLARLYSENL